MSIDERQRYQLHQTLEKTLGPEAAATLMTLLPPVGWADVATKRDLDALGHELRAEIAGVRTEIHKTVRTMTITIVAASAAIVGTTAAVISAIAALTGLFG